MTTLSFPAPSPLIGENLAAEIETAGHGPVSVTLADTTVYVSSATELVESDVAAVVAAHTGQPTPAQQAAAARTTDADTGTTQLANTAGIRAKCKAVLAGTDTFTAAQRDRAIAALVLQALRDRSDT